MVYAVVYALLFVLVLSGTGPVHVALSLYHLCLTLLVSIFSVTLNYNYFIGREDLPPHHAMIQSIYETGTMPEAAEIYEQFALWHVYVGSTSSLSGQWLDSYTALMLLSGSIFAAGVPMVYALAMRLVSNERVALLSCLVLIAIPEYVFYGMYSISRSVTSVLFVALLVTLVASASPRMRLLRILFIGGIVVYHPVTIPFLAVLLGILYGAERMCSGRPYVVDTFTVSIIGVVTAVYWFYRAEFFSSYFLTRLVEMGTELVYGGASGEGAPSGIFEAPWREVANYTPYSFLVLFVLVGFLSWFLRDRERSGAFASFAVASVVMIPLLYPSPVLIVDALAGVHLTEGRFAHYGFVFIALTGGYGLYALLSVGGKRGLLVLIVLLSCFSFVAVSNDFVSSDNPVVDRPFYTYYLTEQEERTFERVLEIHEGALGADHITCHYAENIHEAECNAFPVENETIVHAEFDGVVIREDEFEKRPVYTAEDDAYVSAEKMAWDELAERNRVHDSGTVSYYR
ncbi:hypothetical protein [Natronorubrum bangense]|uniref:hypothetical protein n=1 Tax=Natronorubrum bangense TaxID=61858 RepID=UPI001F4C929E|nr:hypothetical protein [Natronorubrum bangense]